MHIYVCKFFKNQYEIIAEMNKALEHNYARFIKCKVRYEYFLECNFLSILYALFAS